MQCRNKQCQKHLPDDLVYCAYCGTRVKQHIVPWLGIGGAEILLVLLIGLGSLFFPRLQAADNSQPTILPIASSPSPETVALLPSTATATSTVTPSPTKAPTATAEPTATLTEIPVPTDTPVPTPAPAQAPTSLPIPTLTIIKPTIVFTPASTPTFISAFVGKWQGIIALNAQEPNLYFTVDTNGRWSYLKFGNILNECDFLSNRGLPIVKKDFEHSSGDVIYVKVYDISRFDKKKAEIELTGTYTSPTTINGELVITSNVPNCNSLVTTWSATKVR